MRFVFTPPADHAAGLLTLPWSEPLADWRDERLVEIRQRGIQLQTGEDAGQFAGEDPDADLYPSPR